MIEFQHLRKAYGEFAAVGGLELAIKKGEVFGFLGPNGAGKTTTIRMMMGILVPSSGSVKIDGLDCQADRVEVAPDHCAADVDGEPRNHPARMGPGVARDLAAAVVDPAGEPIVRTRGDQLGRVHHARSVSVGARLDVRAALERSAGRHRIDGAAFVPAGDRAVALRYGIADFAIARAVAKCAGGPLGGFLAAVVLGHVPCHDGIFVRFRLDDSHAGVDELASAGPRRAITCVRGRVALVHGDDS